MYRRCNARAVQPIKATATQVPPAVQSNYEKNLLQFICLLLLLIGDFDLFGLSRVK